MIHDKLVIVPVSANKVTVGLIVDNDTIHNVLNLRAVDGRIMVEVDHDKFEILAYGVGSRPDRADAVIQTRVKEKSK